jgi:membrane-bound lytic murein transglycosylase B
MNVIPKVILPFILLGGVLPSASAEELNAIDVSFLVDKFQDAGDSLPYQETYKIQAVPVDAYQAVLDNLKGSGVPESYVKSVFADPNVKIHEEIVAAINKPAESLTYEQYRKLLLTEKRIAGGARFYAANKDLLVGVSQKYGVDPFVLVALVGVESNYGENKGKYLVFNALYTIAKRVPRRSAWAAKELAEFLKICYFKNKGPFTVPGSYAGAFGFGQFMPSSYNAYAVDFDGDKYPDLFTWPDALASISNYLVKHGYFSSPGFSEGSGVWNALYGYNHSANYVNVILELRLEIQRLGVRS